MAYWYWDRVLSMHLPCSVTWKAFVPILIEDTLSFDLHLPVRLCPGFMVLLLRAARISVNHLRSV
jgi:hypothetical protein